MKIGYIYKITNPKGAIYIGQTSRDINIRWEEYKNSYDTKSQKLIYRSIQKYGWENHKFDVILKLRDNSNIEDIETLFIEFFHSYNKEYPDRGLNLVKYGKTPMRGRKHSKETIAKLKIVHLGFKHKSESIEKCRIASTGRKVSKETREKLSRANKGKKGTYKPTNEDIQRMKTGLEKYYKNGGIHPCFGRKVSEENKEKLRQRSIGNKYGLGNKATNRKAIIAYNEDNSIYKEFECMKDALIHFNKKPDSTSHLKRCLDSGKIYCNKYWKYAYKNS